MSFIVDTHILIWFLEGKSALSASRKALIANRDNSVFVSIATLWEIGIKMSLGKLDLSATIPDIIERLDKESIETLSITPHHIHAISSLPFYHRDPFDRMIIAQALVAKVPVMSVDGHFARYGVKLL